MYHNDEPTVDAEKGSAIEEKLTAHKWTKE
jgi:hypothetical protein